MSEEGGLGVERDEAGLDLELGVEMVEESETGLDSERGCEVAAFKDAFVEICVVALGFSNSEHSLANIVEDDVENLGGNYEINAKCSQ